MPLHNTAVTQIRCLRNQHETLNLNPKSLAVACWSAEPCEVSLAASLVCPCWGMAGDDLVGLSNLSVGPPVMRQHMVAVVEEEQ